MKRKADSARSVLLALAVSQTTFLLLLSLRINVADVGKRFIDVRLTELSNDRSRAAKDRKKKKKKFKESVKME